MKVLVLAGPESSGKSWLAARIQAHFGGVLVGEYVRYFIEQVQRDTCYADISTIAKGQLAWEDAARAQRPELLILDTNLLSNMLWSQALFNDCPEWLDPQLLLQHYDMYLLLAAEGVAWVSDPQRCQPALSERQAFFNASHDWLQSHAQPHQILDGDWSHREQLAFRSVGQLLSPENHRSTG